MVYCVSLVLIFTLIFKFAFSYLFPLIIAFMIASLVQKPSHKLSKKAHIPQHICAVLTVIFAFVLVILASWFMAYIFIVFLKSFSGNITVITEKIKNITDGISKINTNFFHKISPEISAFFNGVLSDLFAEITNKTAHILTDFMTGFASKIPLIFLSTVVSLVASCYIAKDYNGWVNFLKGLCNENILTKLGKIKRIFKGNTQALFKGYCKLYLITFIILFTGFLILRVKHAVFLSLFISFVDLLPVLGTGTVLVPWSIFMFFDKNYFLCIGLGILYITVILVRNFLEPKVVGKQVGINPLFTLISMFIGLRIFGVFGLLILPLTLITVIKYYKES